MHRISKWTSWCGFTFWRNMFFLMVNQKKILFFIFLWMRIAKKDSEENFNLFSNIVVWQHILEKYLSKYEKLWLFCHIFKDLERNKGEENVHYFFFTNDVPMWVHTVEKYFFKTQNKIIYWFIFKFLWAWKTIKLKKKFQKFSMPVFRISSRRIHILKN